MFTHSLILVLFLIVFISVFLVFKSQTAGTEQQSPTAAAKGQSQRRYSGARAEQGRRSRHPGVGGTLQSLSVGRPQLRAQGSPSTLGFRLPSLSPLPAWLRGPRAPPPPSSSGAPPAPKQSRVPCPGPCRALTGTQHHISKLTRPGVRRGERGREGRRVQNPQLQGKRSCLPPPPGAPSSTAGSAQAAWRSFPEVPSSEIRP